MADPEEGTMPEYLAIFVSGDNRRTMAHTVQASDVDGAAGIAIALTEGPAFGVGSSWFVAGVVQADHGHIVEAVLARAA